MSGRKCCLKSTGYCQIKKSSKFGFSYLLWLGANSSEYISITGFSRSSQNKHSNSYGDKPFGSVGVRTQTINIISPCSVEIMNFVELLCYFNVCALSDRSPIVTIPALGEVRGSKMISSSRRSFFAFRGIPYAKSPVGELRFKVTLTQI